MIPLPEVGGSAPMITIVNGFWVKNGCIQCSDPAYDWKLDPVGFQLRKFGISRVLTLKETIHNGKIHLIVVINSGYLHDRSTHESVILPFRRTDASPLDLVIEIDGEPKFFSIQYGLTEILSGIQNELNYVTLCAEAATEPYLANILTVSCTVSNSKFDSFVNTLTVSCTGFSNSNFGHL